LVTGSPLSSSMVAPSVAAPVSMVAKGAVGADSVGVAAAARVVAEVVWGAVCW